MANYVYKYRRWVRPESARAADGKQHSSALRIRIFHTLLVGHHEERSDVVIHRGKKARFAPWTFSWIASSLRSSQ